jgi:hypothetical protein
VANTSGGLCRKHQRKPQGQHTCKAHFLPRRSLKSGQRGLRQLLRRQQAELGKKVVQGERREGDEGHNSGGHLRSDSQP